MEGFEKNVFLGANNFLLKVKPDVILFELNEQNSENIEDEPLIKLLKEYKYDFFGIPRNLFRMKLIKLDSIKKNKSLCHDFLAVRKGDVFNEIATLVNVV